MSGGVTPGKAGGRRSDGAGGVPEPLRWLPVPFDAAAGGAFSLPNAFVDDWLPLLKDTEARVWLVVWRQTYGWRRADRTDAAGSPPAFKRRDWLSHAQLVRRTGRGSGAVTAAVAALVGKGLLVVEDASGRAVATREERRRHLGRLYYRASLR